MDTDELARKVLEANFDAKRQIFGKDVCDLFAPTFTDGGPSGDSVSYPGTPTASGLDCFVEELSSANAQTVIGGETYISSNKITMKHSTPADEITPRYQIKVRPRGTKPERVFERPVSSGGSFDPLVVLKASLVQQGYQQ